MNVKPITNYKSPHYPDKNVIQHDPFLLKRVPQRWKNNVYAGVAFSTLMLFTLTACSKKVTVIENGKVVTKEIKKEKGKIIAPIFIHGEGRGSYGCESVAPPIFLSEEEAFDVIRVEAELEGVDLKKDLSGIEKNENEFSAFDGYDSHNKIAVEFVSQHDCLYSSAGSKSFGTVDSIDAIAGAQDLQKSFSEDRDIVVGTFYEPYPFLEDGKKSKKVEEIYDDKSLTYEQKQEELKEISIQQLRAQVKDFIKWLKAQDII